MARAIFRFLSIIQQFHPNLPVRHDRTGERGPGQSRILWREDVQKGRWHMAICPYAHMSYVIWQSYVTCITIIDTIILTNYTKNAYIRYIYTSQELDVACAVRSSNLVQELGMVSNVFSDKTGTCVCVCVFVYLCVCVCMCVYVCVCVCVFLTYSATRQVCTYVPIYSYTPTLYLYYTHLRTYTTLTFTSPTLYTYTVPTLYTILTYTPTLDSPNLHLHIHTYTSPTHTYIHTYTPTLHIHTHTHTHTLYSPTLYTIPTHTIHTYIHTYTGTLTRNEMNLVKFVINGTMHDIKPQVHW
jgi:magnesium-transporting ATPase (P-type)